MDRHSLEDGEGGRGGDTKSVGDDPWPADIADCVLRGSIWWGE